MQSELSRIRRKIEDTEADLDEAKRAKDRDMILACRNNLAELRKKENNLLLAQSVSAPGIRRGIMGWLWGTLYGTPAPPLSHVFVISGVIKFAKLRGDCRQKLFRIAEEKHAKTRVGIADDGIYYQGITKHLQFTLVFKEEAQVEEFRSTVKKIPREYRKRKFVDLFGDEIVLPDIIVEFQPIQRLNWEGDLDLVEEDQHGGDADEPSPEYDLEAFTQTSAVSVNAETRLRMLETEDSYMLFRQKPEKCRIVRLADDPNSINNPNNIVYMSRFLHQQLDVVGSTEGIPQFYFRYVAHSAQHQPGTLNNVPTPVYETSLDIVFKDEEAKSELAGYFNNPTVVNQTTIRLVAYFPNPLEFDYFAKTKAEETLARWASYDGLLNG
eukprot:gene29375-35460_t